MKSSHIDLKKIARELNISIVDLKEILDGVYVPQSPAVLTKKPYTLIDAMEDARRASLGEAVITSNQVIEDDEYHEKQMSPFEHLATLSEPSELYDFLCSLHFSDETFIPAYQKLTHTIKEQLQENLDKDELDDLLSYAPDGSPEESTILKKIEDLEKNEIKSEDDFDELIRHYENDTYEGSSKKLLTDKLIATCTCYEDSSRLIDDVFFEGSTEYYTLLPIHQSFIHRAISEVTDNDDIRSLADSLYNDSDELVMLAQRIVTIKADDAREIWYYEDLFDDDSEALEVLALGALGAISKHSYAWEDLENLIDEISGSFTESSRIGRKIAQFKSEQWRNHVANLTDSEDIQNALSETKSSNPICMDTEQRLISLINDKDDLQELLNKEASRSNLHAIAQKKMSDILQADFGNASTPEEIKDHDDYFDSPSKDEDRWELRLAELITQPDDVSDYSFTDGSYALYCLAQRFAHNPDQSHQISTQKNVAPPEKIVATGPSPEQLEQERINQLEVVLLELKNNDKKFRKQIDYCTTVAEVMKLYHEFPIGTEYRVLAYRKAVQLLPIELRNIKTTDEAKSLLILFPKRSDEWVQIIQALSSFYPKPWYQFW